MTFKRGKKLTLEIRKMEPGQAMVARYIDQTTRDWIDAEGEIKPLTTVIFEDVKTAERFGLFQDAGLRNALTNALVKANDVIEIVKLEKVAMGGGRTVNQYDIFAGA